MELLSKGDGSLGNPDKYLCPKCGGSAVPEYDEDAGGNIVGTGTITCMKCSASEETSDELRLVRIGCGCGNHGSITMPAVESNEEALDDFIRDAQEQGCYPLVDDLPVDDLWKKRSESMSAWIAELSNGS